jgi:RimJ/RimL family protein N-acetyltransferase
VSAPPITVLEVSAEEEAAIRKAVREADLTTLGAGRSAAGPADVDDLVALLSDERVSGPIYDLPRPVTRDSVAAWVDRGMAERAGGEGLLVVNRDGLGEIVGYTHIAVWPDRSAAEVAGAIKAERQNSGEGGSGAIHTFDWVFTALGVRMMCLTAALDNVRSARLIDAAGFQRMGERDSVRPDGTTRRSIYWEVTRDVWRERWGA